MRSDRGTVTIWMLGLTMLLLLFSGIAIDLWRGLSLQRELASMADAAAIAAASGIDEEHYRETGEVLLDPSRSRPLALAAVDAQALDPDSSVVTVAADGLRVTVVVADVLELGLLGVFVDQDTPVTVRASATAQPVWVP